MRLKLNPLSRRRIEMSSHKGKVFYSIVLSKRKKSIATSYIRNKFLNDVTVHITYIIK